MNIIRKKFDKEQTKNMMIDYADVISKAELLYSGERTYNAVIIKKTLFQGQGIMRILMKFKMIRFVNVIWYCMKI